MTAAWMCMGRFVFRVHERLYRNEGSANDEEAWNCIDEPKMEKRGRGLREKLSEKRTGAVGCDELGGREEARWPKRTDAHSSDKLWEIGNTEKGVRAYFLRTVVFG